jgi:hypothetical protein
MSLLYIFGLELGLQRGLYLRNTDQSRHASIPGAEIEPPILVLELCKLLCPSDRAVTLIGSNNMFGNICVNDAMYFNVCGFISVPRLWSEVRDKVNTLMAWELLADCFMLSQQH